jgi:hypothetical protein
MPINIHGKTYVTVAERLEMAQEEIASVISEVLSHEPLVCVRSTVTLKDGRVFVGISAANPSKQIEKMSPYEVAETSAVGRALGFAGYGAVDGIASADEMVKAGAIKVPKKSSAKEEAINTDEPPFEDGPINKAFKI